MANQSEAQKATRRRALGRKLVKHASDLRVMAIGVDDSTDLQFLTAKEKKLLSQRTEMLGKVAGDYDQLGERLEGKK